MLQKLDTPKNILNAIMPLHFSLPLNSFNLVLSISRKSDSFKELDGALNRQPMNKRTHNEKTAEYTATQNPEKKFSVKTVSTPSSYKL